jgi:hypothetical protein
MRKHTSGLLLVMSRYLSAALVGVLILTGAAGAQDASKEQEPKQETPKSPPKSKSTKTRYAPDKSSLVNVGDFAATADQGRLERGTIYAATDKPTFATLSLNMVQAKRYRDAEARARPSVGAAELHSVIQNAILHPDPFTSAINDLVTQKQVINLNVYTAANVVTIAPHTEFNNPLIGDAAEIEIQSGPNTGKKLWVRRTDLVRMVEQTKAKRKR